MFWVLFIAGAAQSSLSSVERYDPRTNTWTMVAPMNMRRSLLNVAVLDGKNYVIHNPLLLYISFFSVLLFYQCLFNWFIGYSFS